MPIKCEVAVSSLEARSGHRQFIAHSSCEAFVINYIFKGLIIADTFIFIAKYLTLTSYILQLLCSLKNIIHFQDYY